MPQVTVALPSLLAGVVGGARTLPIEAETLAGALDELVRQYPALKIHLFDESGAFRQHVLCFHNEESTRWLGSLDRPLAPGDVITIMQAVSGGG
ncbi:MAG: UBA/THIF-type NAD/FAD binding protein [Candidatus Rokubacteria bacterium CSP1-6]|nr:MAG: UBA/THIF-type NAD/FAD binding protein [Candidatus Rokubacteria bacterium CSP1-6]